MRFDRLALKGIGPFASEVIVDFAALPGPLVAVTGGNGAGKSTLLECLAGALHRETPTRGTLAALATARDAFVEVAVTNGKSWRIRQTVDSLSGKGEALVLDEAGEPVLSSAKVTAYDTWAAAHLPSKEVLFASLFNSQGAGGFLDLGAGDRKKVLVRVLGCEHLEERAKLARERANEAKAAASTAAARLADARAGVQDVATAEAALDAARAHAAAVEVDLNAELARLREHETLAQEARDARRAAEEARRARDEVLAALGAARARATDLRERHAQQAAIVARGPEIREAAARVAEIDAEEEGLREELRVLDERARAADRDVEEQERIARAADARARAAAARAEARRAELRSRISEAEAQIAGRRDKIERNRVDLVGRGDAIRAAVARTEAIDARARAIDLERQRLGAERRAALDRAAVETALGASARKRIAEASRLADVARTRLESRTDVERALGALPDARRAVDAADEQFSVRTREIEELRGRRLATADDRIVGLRGALATIVTLEWSTIGTAPQIAGSAMVNDDASVRQAASLPERLSSAEVALALARQALRDATEKAAELDRLAARVPEIEAAERELLAAEGALADAQINEKSAAEGARAAENAADDARRVDLALEGEASVLAAERATLTKDAALAQHLALADERIAAHELEIATTQAEIGRLQTDLDAAPLDGGPEAREAAREASAARETLAGAGASAREARASAVPRGERRGALAAERAHLAGVAREAGALAQAETLAAELERQIAEGERAAADAADRLAAMPEPAAPPPEPDTEGPRADVAVAEGRARSAHTSVAVAERELDAARAAAGRITAIEAEQTTAERDLADWTLLADSLGRDGLQAALIDAAGPELTALVNDLLHTCVSSRWTVTIEAARLSADGKRELAGCEVRVLDTERGREGGAESLSGGERVIVGEAVSLALSMLACRRSGVEHPTLVRDESGAALDEANGRAWIAMLRRAAEIVRADRVLFVSHNTELHALADSRLVIADGRVEVS